MQQYSAYALLQEFKKLSELDLISIKNEFQKDSTYVIEVLANEFKFSQDVFIENPFYQQNLLTENSFLQIIKKDQVDTQIATMGTPYAIKMNEKNFKNQDHLYKYIVRNLDTAFTIQEIRHNSYTVSVSFCEVLKSFIISSSGQTIICQDKNDIQNYERVGKVAQLFFEIYHKLNHAQQLNLAQDLIHRSLVGYRNQFNFIEWYSIMEHYGQQRILPPDIVKKFLNHYNLEPAKSIEYQVNLQMFPTICDSIYNQLIDYYHDYFQGKTIYFWKDNNYLGNCFIPSKHFELLKKMKKLLIHSKFQENQRDSNSLLQQFKLNEVEYDFYQKFLNIMFSIPNKQRNSQNFYNLSNMVFTCIYKKLDYVPQKQDQKVTLAQCLQKIPKVVVLIPVGINGMGYDEMSQIIFRMYEDVQIMSKLNQVNDNKQLYLYDKVCSLKNLKLINDQLKQLPYDVKTVALYPQCSNYYLSEKQSKFPFSSKFIMFCLLSVLDDRNKVNEIFNQLDEFENQNLNHLPTDFQISCQYMPQTKETDNVYSEIIEQDLKAAFQGNSQTNQYLIENLSQYKDFVGRVPEMHMWDQSRKIVNIIEEKAKIIISKKKQQQQMQLQVNKIMDNYYGLYIKNPNWDEIDNFIFDCLEIIIKNYPRESDVNRMYHQLKEQLFKEKNMQIYQRERHPYMLSIKQEQKYWQTQVEVAVIVVDGIIMLQPQSLGLNLLQDIPIYSNNIEVIKSGEIAEIVKKEVEKLQNKSEKEESLIKLNLELNHRNWNLYVVKWKAIKIELVESLVN
ncbi:unnamed protein product [Paramecium sonneborni]|uniref:Uncharacterized protein n=1 Tax=Paramecium sonneborni TaxID=65129 RepID=A0A8S1MYP1_9CILI|nr:unnamed protein product [Paramecium sonneborni]